MDNSPPPPLILASTSPYRRQLLERLGVPFTCRAPLVDEESLKDRSLPALELAERLAIAKATSLVATEPHAVILGSDQIVECEGRILGKTGNRTRAIEQLLSLAGKEHRLLTAICVWHAGTTRVHTDITRLQMRALHRAEVERYVDADQPWDCAGSYKLELRGIALFSSITSADHSAITGLPLIAVTSQLRELGFAIP